MNAKLAIRRVTLVDTVRALQAAATTECVALWLAAPEDGLLTVKEVYRPPQQASDDYFEIPPAGMAAVMARLRTQSYSVAAQVHTHPGEAFHSAADERWAIVRHVGALSVVIPEFGRHVTADRFFEGSAIFRLNDVGRWQQIPSPDEVLFIKEF